MRKIREVLRLKFDAGLSVRKIAKSLSIGHSSAGDYLCRFAASGLQWPIDLSDAELNRHLFPPAVPAPSDQRPMPDWAHVHAELRRPGVTLALLPTQPPARLPVQLVLRALPALGRQGRRGHAPGASCQRKAVRRLRRPDRAGH